MMGLTFQKKHPQRLFIGIADGLIIHFSVLADTNSINY